MRYLLTFFLATFLFSSAFADKDTIVALTGTYTWSTDADWQDGVAPGSTDTAYLYVNGTFITVNITANASINRLEIINGNNFSVIELNIQTGNTLTIADSLILDNSADAFGNRIDIEGTGALLCDNVDMVGAASGTCIINVLSSGTLTVGGNYTGGTNAKINVKGTSTFNLAGEIDGAMDAQTGATGTTLNFNGTAGQTMDFPTGGTGYQNVTFNNTHTDGVLLGANITETNVTGNLDIVSGRFRTGARTIDGNMNDSNLIVRSGATLEIEGTRNLSNFTGYNDTLYPGSTIEYGGSNQTIVAPNDGQTYSILRISGSGTKSLGADTDVDSTLHIAASTLDVTTSNYDLTIGGNFDIDGTYNGRNTDTVTFDGSFAQAIDGTVTIHTLRVNNSHSSDEVDINSGTVTLVRELDIDDGQFNTNGNLILQSNSSGTARLGPIATGASYTGTLTQQRYIPLNSFDAKGSWVFMGSPIPTRIETAWNPALTLSGFTGSDVPTWFFNNVIFYYEPSTGGANNGFFGASNTTDSITVVNTPGDSSYIKGWEVWIGPADTDQTISYAGTPFTGDITHTYSFTAADGAGVDGAHLITHPYCSPIDWDNVNRTGVDATYYIYNSAAAGGDGEFQSYTAGSGGVLGDSIAQCQAYWIYSQTGGGTIDWEENDLKGEGPALMLKETKPGGIFAGDYFTLKLTGEGYSKATWVLIDSNATFNFDGNFDAYQLGSYAINQPFFATLSADKLDLAHNTIPYFNESVTIPVKLTVGVSGTYTIKAEDLDYFIEGTCYTLEDKLTGLKYDLTTDSATFTIEDTTTAPRFLLHIGAPLTHQVGEISCFGMNDGYAIIEGQGDGPWDYTWKDAADSTIRMISGKTVADTLSNISAGTYSVDISNNAACGDVSNEIFIANPGEVKSSFSNSKDTTYLDQGGSVYFLNKSSGSDEYSWDFGDGNISAENSPTHAYTKVGTYTVTLVASNGNCTDTSTIEIVVKDAFVGIIDDLESKFIVYQSGEQVLIDYTSIDLNNTTVSLFDVSGKQVGNSRLIDNNDKPIKLDIRDLSDGVYIVKVSTEEFVYSKKVTISR